MFNPPKKSLGQNFLNDENIQRKIVSTLTQTDKVDRIIEIGPGRGALTKHLTKLDIPLTLIEYDQDLADHWQQEGLTVIHQSILDVDINAHFNNEKLCVIGNIPYNITTPILFKLIENKSQILQSVLMMQKEVAQRLIAPPGNKDYGVLSIMHQLHTETKLAFHVSRNVFFPKPKVDSSVISCLYSHEFPISIENLKIFDNIVRLSFQKRRKMIRSSLKDILKDCDTQAIHHYLERRPEQLSIKDFINLSNHISISKMQL